VGKAMDLKQVTLDLQYNQRIDKIIEQLASQLGNANRKITGTFGASVGGPSAALTGTQIASRQEQVQGFVDQTKAVNLVGNGGGSYFNAQSLASAINHNADSQFWAMLDQNDNGKVYVFNKLGGANNDVLACDVYGVDPVSLKAMGNFVSFENVETGVTTTGGTNFTLGTAAADTWAVMKPVMSKQVQGNQVWNLTLNGRDVGYQRDLWIAAARELVLPGIGDGYDDIINGLDRFSFAEVQNAANSPWAGADVRTQEAAQGALEAINNAINAKDKVRATLGAYQNRLENTISNLEIQAENLQASESRISDADVAKEVIEMTKNTVLVQAAMGMVAQANSLNNLALSLIGR